jgi:hypothetical protein
LSLPSPKSALAGFAAVLLSFGIVYAICMRIGTNPSPAILAAALAVGLARKPEHLDVRRVLLSLVTLPLVALGAGIVALTLRTIPVLGAALFCSGVTASVWLRNFGERGGIVGRALALPFLTMLIAPVRPDPALGPVGNVLFILGAGLVAVTCSFLVQRVVR